MNCRGSDDIARAAMIRPVILSGGGGTRLWPLSRSGHPKQFHRLAGDQSLLQDTAQRCRGGQFAEPVISTGEEQRFFVLDQLEAIGVIPATILLEPAARNTAPAIAAAAHWALDRGEDDPLLVMPSDHVIQDIAAFHEAIEKALPAALEGNLLTFGIHPTAPKTGYGYIKSAQSGEAVRKVERFVEKPDLARAKGFVADGSYFWNSGIFMFRPSAFLAELAEHSPDVAKHVAESMKRATLDKLFLRPDAEAFSGAPSISIDYAVMEHSDHVQVVPASFGWSDVGSWSAVHEFAPVDERGNFVSGDVLAVDISNSLIRSDADLTVAAVGLDSMICIVTGDAAFIAPIERAEEVKEIVEQLRARGHARADEPARVYRPWGSYETVDRGDRFQTKRIIVKPGGRLSLQKHQHRSEHWVVVEGIAEVTIGTETKPLHENESVYIPAGTLHRLANPGEHPLHIIEVQCGSYLGEDDIVRVDDEYGRS
jgi:mannose-1-phosphate guanylyltransferase / mannose-6-phosphate isomerase